MLALLHRHATRAEHTFRHRWTAGDVVIWDNRSTMHVGIRDFGRRPQAFSSSVTVAIDVPTTDQDCTAVTPAT